MAFLMTEPTLHPRTGTYRVRVTIPQHLRAICKRDHGKGAEFIKSLGTKSRYEAARLAPAVVADFKARLAAAQAECDGREVRLTDLEVSSLCGRWLTQQEAATRNDIPEPVGVYEERVAFLDDVLQGWEDPDALPMTREAEAFLAEDIGRLLASEGLCVTHDSRRRLVTRLAPVQREHYNDLAARLRTGRWQRTISPTEFPSVAPSKAKGTAQAATLDALLAGWALDHGWRVDMKPIPRALYDRVRTVERLAEFMGHRDAARITKSEVVRWKGDMMGRGLNAATVRNDMSEMSAIWKWGQANGLIDSNPFAGTLPPKPSKRGNDKRGFTDAEAAAILQAARGAKGYLRWLPWALCATGARLNEMCQATRDDISTIDGVVVIRIHDEGEDRSLKNHDSRRVVPLHPALIAEGFLAYVDQLKPGSSLWPDMAPDKLFGRRSSTGGKRVARWLKLAVGISDPKISPSHSWRHYFIERCRRVVMPLEVRSALTGHSARMDESAGYGAGVGTMVQIMASHLATVPLADLSAPTSTGRPATQ